MLASRTVVLALKQRIIDAATPAGDRVHIGHAWPIATLPAVRLELQGEDLTAEADDITWPQQRTHALDVVARCLVQQATDPDAAADSLAEQVLLAAEGTQAAATLAPLVGVSVAAVRIDHAAQADGEASTAATDITFRILFGTASNDPATLI